MRITTLLIGIQACFTTVLLADSTNAQSINLDVKQANVKQVFVNIEKQANVTFVYNDQTLQGLPEISIKEVNKSLEEILKSISAKVPLQFKQSGSVIGVSRTVPKPAAKEPATEKPLASDNAPPPINITGQVLNAQGLPIAGVSITIKETKKATISDINGMYSISAESSQTLVFTYVGFKKQEIPINGKGKINVSLEESISTLDDVHVIAYGTTTQRLSTGSIAKITASEIEEQPVSNPLAALEGRAPGLIVTQNNGVPGSNFTVQVQGQNAFATGNKFGINLDPLFIIDGVPFAPNNNNINQIGSAASPISPMGLSPFNEINPADIESIEVLKDADATAIYGSRGAYGVILITTKQGKSGKTIVNAIVNSGLSSVTRTMPMLNSQQYLQMRQEAFKNDGVTPTAANAPDLVSYDPNRYTNWEKQLIGNTAHMTDAEATISGGTENTTFLIGGGYHNETTVLPGNNGDSRASFHINLNHTSADKKFNVKLSAIYTSDINKILALDLTNQTNLPPNYPALRDANGNLLWQYNGVPLYWSNPLGYVNESYTAQTNNLLGNLSLSYKPMEGLTLRTSLGYNSLQVNEIYTTPTTAEDPSYGTPQGYSNFGNNAFGSWIIEPQAEYVKVILKGKLDILTGGTWQQNTNTSSTISATGYTSDALLQSESAAGSLRANNAYTLYHYEAVFGRINYNWEDEYLLNISGRRDGSSRFGPGKQFGNFGAAGIAWIFSKEKFVADQLPFLSFGKLRSSYGITGSDQIGDYQFLGTWTSTSNPYQSAGLYPNRLADPNFSWATNKKFAVGIDLGFFNDKILLSTDYYRNRTSNQLISYTLPYQTGFTSILENLPATVQNTGLELVLSSKNIVSKGFNWSTNFSMTIPQNKLVSFPGLATSSYSTAYVVGQPLSVIKGIQYLGVNSQTGVMQFKDQNGDGVINTNDLVPLGNLDPKFYGGLQNTFRYYNWTLSIFFDFRKQLGVNYMGSIYKIGSVPGFMNNDPTTVLSAWQKPGDITNIPQFTESSSSAAYTAEQTFANFANSGKYSDASFIRLKTLSFGYNLPSNWARKFHVSSSKIFIQGQNLLTITHYQGADPETQNLYTLPPLKTLTAGLQITL